MKSYNLIDEPWLPVTTHCGKVVNISLMEVLLNGKDYSGIADTSPPNIMALYRLLLAIVHRAMTLSKGKWTDNDRASWFKNGFPKEGISNYLKLFYDRFWFFHPEYPFMQVQTLESAEETRSKDLKNWTKVTIESSSGDTPLVFDHSSEDSLSALLIGQAVRNLLGYLQFVPGGLVKILRVSDKSGPLANTAAILPIGSNITETLCLALHPFNSEEEDLPAWELLPPTIQDLNAKPKLVTGPNDRYTRLTRAALWVSDTKEGYVRQLRFCEGLSIEESSLSPDPMASYRESKSGELVRISFYEGRAIWRDLPSFIPDRTGKFSIAPAVMGWAVNLYDEMGEWDKQVEVLVSGIASDQAKILRWRVEKINFPQEMMKNPDAISSLKEQIKRSEFFYSQLRKICVSMIAEAMPEKNHKDTMARARLIQDNGPGVFAYFSNVERGVSGLLQEIATGNLEKAFQDWSVNLVFAVQNSWEASRKMLGDSPFAIKSKARTSSKFERLLNQIKSNQTVQEMEKIR